MPPAVIALVAALIGGAFWWRRRRNQLLALPAPDYAEVPPEPVAAAPKPAVARTPVAPAVKIDDVETPETVQVATPDATPAETAIPATVTTDTAPPPAAVRRGGRRADLDVLLEPINASTTLINLRMRYALTFKNTGVIDAANITVRFGVFAGQQASEQGVGQWLSMEDQPIDLTIEALPAGEETRIEQEVAIPLSALGALEIEGRRMAVALMAVDTRYAHPKGEQLLQGHTGKAFVVGREPPATAGATGKLAPFRLDQGPTSFAPLGARDTGITRRA